VALLGAPYIYDISRLRVNTVITVFGLLNKGTERMTKKLEMVFLVENLKKRYQMGDTSMW
jgi:Na+/pantothenate symporter